MVVFIVRKGFFNNGDGRGTGATTAFGVVGLFVAGGSGSHAEQALVPLAVDPNVSENTAFKASLMIVRVVLGQWSEDDGATGNPLFFRHVNGVGK